MGTCVPALPCLALLGFGPSMLAGWRRNPREVSLLEAANEMRAKKGRSAESRYYFELGGFVQWILISAYSCSNDGRLLPSVWLLSEFRFPPGSSPQFLHHRYPFDIHFSQRGWRFPTCGAAVAPFGAAAGQVADGGARDCMPGLHSGPRTTTGRALFFVLTCVTSFFSFALHKLLSSHSVL